MFISADQLEDLEEIFSLLTGEQKVEWTKKIQSLLHVNLISNPY